MALLTPPRSTQYPLVARFTWNWDDTMVNTSGSTDDFKVFGSPHVFDVIPLPPGAVVVGGQVATVTAVTGSTAYNVKVGDSGSDVRYLGTTDRVAAGSTPLLTPGFANPSGLNIRLTVTPTIADATAGSLVLTVFYVIAGRANETQVS